MMMMMMIIFTDIFDELLSIFNCVVKSKPKGKRIGIPKLLSQLLLIKIDTDQPVFHTES
jgi:hypothetical protein